MSKMDNLRAMREARYDRAAGTPAKRPSAPRAKVSPAPEKGPAPTATSGDEPDAGLCGHRAISGRTCTRERGHAAKSHRYS